tara:strand:+ start:179 stop:502 length:324 start_codon:yes stop_codon:yes gene_type:complete
MIKWLKILLRNYCSSKSFAKGKSKTKRNTTKRKRQTKLSTIIKQIGRMHTGKDLNLGYGVCPHCEFYVSMISFRKGLYTCFNCRELVRQHINGSVKYVPVSHGENKV